MTESEVRKLLRQMKELDSQTAFRDFYNMTYDRLFRIAYYYVKQEEWSQEIVLDVFLKLWKQMPKSRFPKHQYRPNLWIARRNKRTMGKRSPPGYQSECRTYLRLSSDLRGRYTYI